MQRNRHPHATYAQVEDLRLAMAATLYGGRLRRRVRQFKLSNDPNFVDKLRDVVGLYVDPRATLEMRRLPIDRRFPNRHQQHHRGDQPNAQAPHLNRQSRQNHPRRQMRVFKCWILSTKRSALFASRAFGCGQRTTLIRATV